MKSPVNGEESSDLNHLWADECYFIFLFIFFFLKKTIISDPTLWRSPWQSLFWMKTDTIVYHYCHHRLHGRRRHCRCPVNKNKSSKHKKLTETVIVDSTWMLKMNKRKMEKSVWPCVQTICVFLKTNKCIVRVAPARTHTHALIEIPR